jgi:hypothetical protein
MKKAKRTKHSAPDKAVEKPAIPTQASTGPQPAKPAVAASSFDPERDELACDERGETYVRKTPKGMFEDAEQEANQRELADYRNTISLLREKGFSFREIAEFLTERGVCADHNAVYRAYTKFMTEEEAALEARMDEENREQSMG